MPKTDVIHIRVSEDTKAKITAMVDQDHTTVTDLIVGLIERTYDARQMTKHSRKQILNLIENQLDLPLAD